MEIPPSAGDHEEEPTRGCCCQGVECRHQETGGGDDLSAAWHGAAWEASWPSRRSPVMLEGYVADAADDGRGGTGGVGTARSLTDDDLEELKGCVDLGFGFSYDEIPELCGTLPALELCYSMSQRFLDGGQQPEKEADAGEVAASLPPPPAQHQQSPVANWKISSPGDSPDEVKARLRFWAQAVACTVKLLS